eukprot:scaffold153_cov201-Chaetoceros_neogracile.AAC.4
MPRLAVIAIVINGSRTATTAATEGKGKEGEIGEHGINRSLLTCNLQDQKMMMMMVYGGGRSSTRESR